MKSTELASILTKSTVFKPGMGFKSALAALGLFSFVLIVTTLGIRPDLYDSMANGGFWFKTIFLGASFILSVMMLRQSAYPVARRSTLPLIYAALWGGLMIGAVYQIVTTAFAGILPQWQSPTGLTCVGFVFLYGLIGQIFLIKIMQHFAPADLAAAGRNMALASAAAGGIGYSIHCNMDSPAYIIFAYGLPTLVLALMGTYILPRFIRW